MKIVSIDIETAPKKAFIWRFWKENISTKQLIENGYIMSMAWKWLGQDNVHYAETRTEDDRELVEEISAVLNEADLVIAHNGDRFDIPMIRTRAVTHGMQPWSPHKVIDTLKVAKREFRFEKNTLEHIAYSLGVDAKGAHKEFPGFELWAECILGNEKAWEEMKKYNIQDVEVLEQVYLKMRPWMTNHPNIAVNGDFTEYVCPKCGSKHVHKRGHYFTNVGKYQRFQCQDCGGWGRSRYTENEIEVRKALLTNAV